VGGHRADRRDRSHRGRADVHADQLSGRYMSEFFTAAGLTTVHDADALRQSILPYEDTRRHGELRHRVCIMMDGPALFSSFKAAGIYTGFGDEWVRIGGVKYVA